MYLQITTRCNMNCEHCGMNCTKEGEDMDHKTFKNALTYFSGDFCTIGGGEPTLHKDFEKILFDCIGNFEYTHIITNGSITKKALNLARLAEITNEQFGAELSQDDYHDEIDTEVVVAFDRINAIRYTSDHLINNGRCDFGYDDACICSDIIIKPDGSVYVCGCDNSPYIGNINDSEFKIPENCGGECYKEIEKRK